MAAGISLAVGACSPETDDANGSAASEVVTNKSLASLISETSEFSTIAGVLSEAGVASAFDGTGTYTVLAPTDDALGALSEATAGMDDEERRVLLIALLRSHILPGEITPESIRETLAGSGGAVEMRNLADGVVKFTLDGNAITIEGQDGLEASVSGDALIADNGAIIPVDSPLAPFPEG